jgi:hypothetical protein
MKGIAVETILYAVILVIAIILLTFLVMKLVPTFGDFISYSLNGVKESLCKLFGGLGEAFCKLSGVGE